MYAPTVQSVTVSSVNTGGITAGASETISSSDASSEIHTVIKGDDTGGTADVEITTKDDGVRKTETRHYVVPPGKPIIVEASSSAGSVGSLPTGQAGTSAKVRVSTSTSMIFSVAHRIFAGASRFFHNIFSWFGR